VYICAVLLPPGVKPIAVKKMYHIPLAESRVYPGIFQGTNMALAVPQFL